MGRGILVLSLSLVAGVGCARRAAVALPDLTIPVSCAAEIRLVGCDAQMSPPKCKSARVTYRRGCEEIVVTNEQQVPHR